MYCVMFAVAIVAYIIIMGVHAERTANASRVNEEFKAQSFDFIA